MKSPKETLSAALAASTNPASDDAFGTHTDAQAEADRCGILVRVSPALRRELKLAALTRDTTVQALVVLARILISARVAATFSRRAEPKLTSRCSSPMCAGPPPWASTLSPVPTPP
jgi:hypothetical protein